MRIFKMPMIFLMVLPSYTLAQPLIVENVTKVLQVLSLDQEVTILGINSQGDEVVAQALPGRDLKRILESRPDFGRDIGRTAAFHKGCSLSFRLKVDPSLQVTFCQDDILMDLDRWGPWFWKPSMVKHFLLEVVWHDVQKGILRHPEAKTNQQRMAKRLPNWEQRYRRRFALSLLGTEP